MDSDLWWHLRAGQVTVETGRPLTTDIFSYTREGENWVNHSWLSQVMLYGLFQLAGFSGLAAWVSILTVGCLLLILMQMGGAAWWRSLLMLLTVITIAPVLSPRPQVFSLVMFAGLNWLMAGWKQGKVQHLWILPILFLFWSNLHGGYSLGFLLLAAFLGGQVINHLLDLPEKMDWKMLGKVLLWTGLAFLAVAVNPNGMAMWKIPFQTVGVEALQQFIPEWLSPDFHEVNQMPVLIVIVLLVSSLAFSGRKLNGVDFLTTSGFLCLALISRRNIAPFTLAAIPIIANLGWTVVTRVGEKIRAKIPQSLKMSSQKPVKANPGINLLLAGIIGFAAFAKLGVVSLPAAIDTGVRGMYPQTALDWIRQNPSQGRMLSEYSWGGYLDWYLPESRVFVDGRTDLFGDVIIMDWRKVVQADPEMADILNQWEIDRVLLEPSRPGVIDLKQMGWRILFEDSSSILLERPSP